MKVPTLSLQYFPLWAKGPGPALALSHSTLPWSCEILYKSWPKLKPTTDFSKLPILRLSPTSTISHELAILSYISKVEPEMSGGGNVEDWSTSMQLMCECDDIYAKLTRYQPTTSQPSKCAPGELSKLWNSAPDISAHNREQGLHGNLALMERFGGGKGGGGRFTGTGVSVGECKLFSTLHALVMIEGGVLDNYGRLGEFYDRFKGLEGTVGVMEGNKFEGGRFEQYFVRG